MHSPDAGSPPGSAGSVAQVLITVSLQGHDQIFDYLVPPELVSILAVGHRVVVPFGRRQTAGYVVALTDRPAVDPEKLRPILRLDGEDLHLTQELMDLSAWLAGRYLSLRSQALRVMLPPGAGRVQRRRDRFIKPAVPAAELAAALEALPANATRQAALLRLLLEQPQGMAAAQALGPKGGTSAALNALAEKGLIKIEHRDVHRDPLPPPPAVLAGPPPFTPAQADCCRRLQEALGSRQAQGFLLHGVTASGKTEVYLEAIRQCLAMGRTALYLVPEISLTPQSVDRFRRALGAAVAVLHSGLSEGERYDQWRRIRQGEAQVVVGARSAVFAPVDNLGLIILDEEHEPAFKQDEAPRYHARTVAWERVRRWGGVLLCGSATPSLESRHRVEEGRWQLLTMPDRVDGRPMPSISIVDQREERAAGRSVISEPLAEALTACVAKGEQAILFLNRRGFATIVLCRECGHAEECPRCSVALTFHRGRGLLLCHYCGLARRPPLRCPGCGGTRIGFFGVGTERVEQDARELLPGARIARLDADTVTRKGSHQRVYRAFATGEIDVLIGTQMVAKGWDIPGVTLVGVISADTALHLPDFRSGERTVQLLMQVAGRAGRGDKPGQVIIQTFNPEHPAVTAVAQGTTEQFWRHEMDQRRALGYPPFGTLVRLLASAREEAAAQRALADLAAQLQAGLLPGVELLGPARAPLGRLRSLYRWQLVLRGRPGLPGRELRSWLAGKLPGLGSWRQGGVRVSIDVDPASLL